MNTSGTLFRLSMFGEAHGEGIGPVIEGCPAVTPSREPDAPRFLRGLYRSRATGAPLMIWFENRDARSRDYAEPAFRIPRPGHADVTARGKFGGFNDPRGGGMFSGRLTVALVGAAVVFADLPLRHRGIPRIWRNVR